MGLRIDKPLYNNASFKSAILTPMVHLRVHTHKEILLYKTMTTSLYLMQNGVPVTNGAGQQLDNGKLPSGNPFFLPDLVLTGM